MTFKTSLKLNSFIPFSIIVLLFLFSNTVIAYNKTKVLLFTKMTAYVHEPLPAKAANLTKLLQNHNFDVTYTNNATVFNDDSLKKYATLIFMDCSGDLFTESEKKSLC